MALEMELIIMIRGNGLVSREATNIERNRLEVTKVAIRGMDKSIRSNVILEYSQLLKTKIEKLQMDIARQTISKDAFTRIAVVPACLSEKLFPKRRTQPVETPTSAIPEKIRTKEITVDEVPITSGLTILEIKNQIR